MYSCFRISSLLLILTVFNSTKAEHNFQSTLGHIKTNTNTEVQRNAVHDLIKRIIPLRATEFDVEINSELDSTGKDAFALKNENGTIKITGSTGVAAATGFNYYLKYYCFSQIAWQVSQINLPEELPEVDIKIILNDKFRYYQNVCTTSYSFVWWNWTQWEKHIDWMAMNSFNLVLAFNGQEAIWQKVYQKFNLTQNEIDEQFTGPAFLSWLRMGNIRAWAGPLPNSWHKRSLILQKQILKRMREFGIIPVLPAFAGHLPKGFKRLYPDANMAEMGKWNNFNESYSTYFLDPTESLFKTIGKLFIEEQIAEYGTDHVYNCDSFNENTPPSTDLQYLANVSQSIYGAITDADPDGIWLMQGWLFYYEMEYWTNERVEALLTAVPLGKMIILDLQSEQFPQYNRLEQYFGQPYIWCMLHNFGGTLGNFGSVSILNTEPIKARNAINSTMIGIGLTPEGINQNYVIYDFMVENAWRNETENVEEWTMKYIKRRYGSSNSLLETSWNYFMRSVYDFNGTEKIRGHYAITSTPNWEINTWSWYDGMGEYVKYFMIFANGIYKIDEFENCSTCIYDLTDFQRQFYQIQGDFVYEKMRDSFNDKNLDDFRLYSYAFLQILEELDIILQKHPAFLLGRWLSDAKNCANSSDEEKLYEYNARNQITLWGPKGEIMNYANKQWSGMVADFFLPRWQLFIDYCLLVLSNNTEFNQTYIEEEMFKKVEEPFTFSTKIYPTEVNGVINAKNWLLRPDLKLRQTPYVYLV